MNPRERVLAAAAHREPDRVPFDYWARRDVSVRLMKHLGVEDHEALLRRLGVDMRGIPVGERHPGFDERCTVLGGESESSGRKYLLHPDGSFESRWGIVMKLGRDGLYDQWLRGPFSDDRRLERFDWPDPDVFDPVETIRERVAGYAGNYALLGRVNLPFKICWHMRGLENFLCDMIADPGYARELTARIAAYEREKGRRLARAEVDIVGIYGDLAMQDRMLVKPAAWRAIEKPILAGMIAAFKEEKPGLLVFFHSDGDVSEIIPDLVEIGVDILNPVQPECLDPAAVKRDYGDRLTLHGTISIQRTLPRGAPADVRHEVARRLDTCGHGGGLIICPANMIQNDTPLENIVALYEAARVMSRGASRPGGKNPRRRLRQAQPAASDRGRDG